MSQPEAYEYSKLAPGEIRLLRFKKTQTVIHLELHHCSDPAGVKYFALSYCWGDDTVVESILCNGKELRVGVNLFEGLQELKKKEEVANGWLWIDAICINQDDNDEKAVQVKLMSSIYSDAHKVLVWLGVARDNSDLATDEMGKVVSILRFLAKSPDMDKNQAKTAAVEIVHQIYPREHPIWSALMIFYDRPWFCRGWILQEIVLAKAVCVYCGTRTLPWATIASFGHYVTELWLAPLFDTTSFGYTGVTSLVRCALMEAYRSNKGIFSNDVDRLIHLIAVGRESNFTNPHDHIYGFLGLTSDAIRAKIRVSYSQSVEQTCIDFCKTFIQEDTELFLLSMVDSPLKAETLPSWCPDLSATPSGRSNYGARHLFRAGKSSLGRGTSVQVCSTSNTIAIQGFCFGSIRGILPIEWKLQAHGSPPTQDDAASDCRLESECFEFYRDVSTSSTLEATTEEYCWTLVAGFEMTTIEGQIMSGSELLACHDAFKRICNINAKNKPDARPEFSTTLAFYEKQKQHVTGLFSQNGRKLFSTDGGRIGMGPPNLQPGDAICVLYSGRPLYALRFDPKSGTYKLIGDAYMYGLMDLDSTPMNVRGEDRMFTIS